MKTQKINEDGNDTEQFVHMSAMRRNDLTCLFCIRNENLKFFVVSKF